jgi:hypothetical protein
MLATEKSRHGYRLLLVKQEEMLVDDLAVEVRHQERDKNT